MQTLRYLFFLISLIVHPALASDMQDEIDHLLGFVGDTECQYERNGTRHTGKEALGHIQKKYAYFKEDIDSAEKFIELSATKSTVSGKYYRMHCKDEPVVKSQIWLLRELENYRNKPRQ